MLTQKYLEFRNPGIKRGNSGPRKGLIGYRTWAMAIIWGQRWVKVERSILTSVKKRLEKGESEVREALGGKLERRMRYEGEGAWENRGTAQVPFYNSGRHVARQQTPAGVTTSFAFLNHKSIRRPQHSILMDSHGHLDWAESYHVQLGRNTS